MLSIKIRPGELKDAHWYSWALRILFGGTITVLAGVIAKKYGPGVGGLFLAFPAILPASMTLVERHEKQKKRKLGLDGRRAAHAVASVDAAGASIGALGMAVFGWVVWRWLPGGRTWMVLVAATVAWAVTAVALWMARKRV
jgi:Protein of unknown function (DUF3147)